MLFGFSILSNKCRISSLSLLKNILLESNCFMTSSQLPLYSQVDHLYACMKIPSLGLSFPLQSPQSIEQSSLCYRAGSHQLISYTVVHICQFPSPSSSYPTFPFWHPQVCSLCLCLCFSFAKSCTIFPAATWRTLWWFLINYSTTMLLLLLLSRFRRVRRCVTPQTAAHQAPLSWDSPGRGTGVGCHFLLQCMKVKSESEAAQSCPTLSNPMDCSPPGSSVHGSFQARVLEWGAIAFSTALPYNPAITLLGICLE